MTIQQLATQDKNVLAVYEYGSKVYGTHNEKSDEDFIVVLSNKTQSDAFIHALEAIGDVNIYDEQEFQTLINEHEITALECLFLPQRNIIKAHDWQFTLYLPQLRQSLSAKSSNSWVKAKKKFIVEKDFNDYVGKKSAWHALRILDFGHQIATQGKITNYASMNEYRKEILACNSWDEINEKFKSIYNKFATDFKQVAPKEVNLSKMKI